jgi:hypothetical protein
MGKRNKNITGAGVLLLFFMFCVGCDNDIAGVQSAASPPPPLPGEVVFTPFEGAWEHALDDLYTIRLTFEGNTFAFTQNEITISQGTFTYTEDSLVIRATHRYNGLDLVPLAGDAEQIQQGNYVFTDTTLALVSDGGTTEYKRTE